MAKVFSVFMQKGGVGKTTITFMLAYELAKHGKTLMIDGDQQGNLTMLCNNSEFEKNDFLSVLQEKSTVQESIKRVNKENVDLHFIGTKKNDTLFKQYTESFFRDEPFLIKGLLNTIKQEGFEYIFFDLPPSFGFYEKIILAQTDEIIPIIEPAESAVTSFFNLHKDTKKLQVSYDCNYIMDKLIINKTNSQKKASDHWLKQMLLTPGFTKYQINDSKAMANSTDLHLTIQEYNSPNAICDVLKEIAKAIK